MNQRPGDVMNFVAFTYSGKFGHFLRAEANANGVTYPVPPRTALLGLVGAVLGLEKDSPQQLLADAHLGVGGAIPRRFWHKTNVRKDPPAPLPVRVKSTDKGSSSEQRNFRFPQEWLWKPSFRVWAALPGAYQREFAARLRERRWHYGPCLGLSEMLAELTDVVEGSASRLDAEVHPVQSVAPQDVARVDTAAACDQGLALQTLRMPVSATAERVFSHRAYWVELQGRPFPAETADAWQCGCDVVAFL
jgi:CRISPR-associated protein Cas5h